MIDNSKDSRNMARTVRDTRMVFYTSDGESVSMEGWFIDQPLILVCGGPSLKNENLELLRDSGVMTMGVNNTWGAYRPDIWVCADAASRFLDSGWSDPRILKLCPFSEANTRLRRKTDKGFSAISLKPCNAPKVLLYKKSVGFNPETFLDQPTPSLGAHSNALDLSGVQGSRSVMLIALRMAYHLGFRKIGIIGADFSMSEDGEHYAVGEKHTGAIARGNNGIYTGLNERFKKLDEHFKSKSFSVVNCTPESKLTAFKSSTLGQFLLEVGTNEGPEGQDSVGWYDNHEPQRATELDYYLLREGGAYSKWHQRIYNAAISLINSESSSVLDVGCGMGFGLQKMREAGMKGHWSGIDFETPTSIIDGDELKRSSLMVGSFESVSDQFEPHDHVWCIEVLEHLVGDPTHFLSEIRRLTKKSAIISTPDSSKNDHGTKTSDEWAALIRQAGFITSRTEVGGSVVFVCEPVKED